MNYFKTPEFKVTASIFASWALMLVIYWIIGETLTTLALFTYIVMLWWTLDNPNLVTTQQALLRSFTTMRQLTGGENATRIPAIVIEMMIAVIVSYIMMKFLGFSWVPCLFLIASYIYAAMVIEIRLKEVMGDEFVPINGVRQR